MNFYQLLLPSAYFKQFLPLLTNFCKLLANSSYVYYLLLDFNNFYTTFNISHENLCYYQRSEFKLGSHLKLQTLDILYLCKKSYSGHMCIKLKTFKC